MTPSSQGLPAALAPQTGSVPISAQRRHLLSWWWRELVTYGQGWEPCTTSLPFDAHLVLPSLHFLSSLTKIDRFLTARAQRGLPSECLRVGRAFKGKRPWLGLKWRPGLVGPPSTSLHSALSSSQSHAHSRACHQYAFFRQSRVPSDPTSCLQEGPPASFSSSQGFRCPPAQPCQQLNPQET